VSSDVVVLGSANLDLVFAVQHIPAAGETVLARNQERHCGGKGLNQAIAAARAGASTTLLGAVGRDDAGALVTDALRRDGIDIAAVRTVDAPTGTAIITVAADGDNAIVVAAGANGTVDALTQIEREVIAGADVLVTQLEIPVSAVAEGVAVARSAGTITVLNAAPAQRLGDALLRAVDYLVVNEHEARTLGGGSDPVAAARALCDRCGVVVVTLGARGAVCVTSDGAVEAAAAPAVEVVDTTGAGDAFTGVLAVGLAEQLSLTVAVRRAVVAGAISVERPGASPSVPTRAQVDQRLGRPPTVSRPRPGSAADRAPGHQRR